MQLSRFAIAALALSVSLSSSAIFAAAAAPAAPATPPATAPAKVGTVTGKVVDKEGKPAVGAQVRATVFVEGAPPGGGRGAGGRGAGGRGGAAPDVTDDKGMFTIKTAPVGKVTVTANLMGADGTRLRGSTTAAIDVKENETTTLKEEIKLADAPARGAGGGGAGGAGGGRGGRGGAGGGAGAPPAGQ